MTRIPIIPTALVVAAAAVMVALGIWQLGRADEKAELIARYETNRQLPSVQDFRPFSSDPDSDPKVLSEWSRLQFDDLLFRSVEMPCPNPGEWTAVAGRNANGQAGYVHKFVCDWFKIEFVDGSDIDARVFGTIGWSQKPGRPDWQGGTVIGILAPSGDNIQVFASEPLAGLKPLAKPDPADLPNNHLAYAGQWFFFALTALVIYWLALRARLAMRD